MGNYSGREFDPDFDRTDVDILCISEKSDIVQKPVDPADPYRSSHIGIFERCIETGDKRKCVRGLYTGRLSAIRGWNLCVCTWKNISRRLYTA